MLSNDIETVIKTYPKCLSQLTKAQAHMGSLQNFTRPLKRIQCQYFPNYSTKQKRKHHFQMLFISGSIVLISKPEKDTTTKKKIKPISLMNIDTKSFNKTLENGIQKHENHSAQTSWLHSRLAGLVQHSKSTSVNHHLDGLKRRNHMINSTDTEGL